MVTIGVLKERHAQETRVSAVPEIVKRYVELGARVIIESGAGVPSSFLDKQYQDAGATIEPERQKVISGSDIVLGVQPEFMLPDMGSFKPNAVLVGLLNPQSNRDHVLKLAESGITAFGMEFVPRITRAQSMDVLSSQSNLAGYKAVLEAFNLSEKVVPMMMTAAGRISPAKVLVLGAGVAGLQAIATAKRMGAIVSAFDVRPAVKEQVQSLGATFIEVPSEEVKNAETAGGYAKEMSEEYKQKQAELIHQTALTQDFIISTALIPGKPAPVLIPEATVKEMKNGAIIVDLATASGGNCPLSEVDRIVEKHGVKIIGYTNMPGRVSVDASSLYARNLFNFVSTLIHKDTKELVINNDDDIIKGCLLTQGGKVVHPVLNALQNEEKAAKPVEELPKRMTNEKPHLKKQTEDEAQRNMKKGNS